MNSGRTRVAALRGVGLLVMTTMMSGLVPLAASAQEAEEEGADSVFVVPPVDSSAARVPFGPGEHLTYKVKVGIFGAGEGHMSIVGLDTVRGHSAYQIQMGIDGGLAMFKVKDSYQSWLDVGRLMTWRFIQDIHEVNYKSYRHYEMYPDRQLWDREDNDEFGPLGSELPLDDIAFIYYVRTLPLEVGESYTLDRYFKVDGNPVVINVIRRDERETEAGKFQTIVVKPVIKTAGLFGEGGDAELHFTDDERRILVYLKSNIPKFPGSLTLHLKTIEEGLPLHPEARAEALARRAADHDGAAAAGGADEGTWP